MVLAVNGRSWGKRNTGPQNTMNLIGRTSKTGPLSFGSTRIHSAVLVPSPLAMAKLSSQAQLRAAAPCSALQPSSTLRSVICLVSELRPTPQCCVEPGPGLTKEAEPQMTRCALEDAPRAESDDSMAPGVRVRLRWKRSWRRCDLQRRPVRTLPVSLSACPGSLANGSQSRNHIRVRRLKEEWSGTA